MEQQQQKAEEESVEETINIVEEAHGKGSQLEGKERVTQIF